MFRKDIAEALQQRKEIRVDPFRQGFDHANSPQTIDLNAVRLCFQVRYPAKKCLYHRHVVPVLYVVL
jgi:Rel/ankyrin family protein